MVGNSYKSRKCVSGYLSLRRVNSKCSDFGWILGVPGTLLAFSYVYSKQDTQ